MANTINSQKLLPAARSSAIVKVDKSKSLNFLTKKTSVKSGALVKSESKESRDVNNKLVRIDSFFKSELIASQKKSEQTRKKDEKQDFEEAEKKLETPKMMGLGLPKFPQLPKIGFLERIKRFIFFTAVGWALPTILELLPKLEGILKIIGGVYNFAEGLFGKLFDGFMSLVKFGGDLKDKTIGFIASAKASVGGDYQTEFNKLEKQFNDFANLSIVAGLLSLDIGLAAVDEYNKWKRKSEGAAGAGGRKLAAEFLERKLGRKLTSQELKDLGVKPSSKEARAIQRPGTKAEREAAKQQRRVIGAQLRKEAKIPKPKPSLWQKLTGGLKSKFSKFAGKLAKPFKKFAGAAIPGIGAAVGFMDAQSRSKSGDKLGAFLAGLSASLDAFTAAVAIAGLASAATGIGIPAAAALGAVAAAAGTISMGIDVVLLIRDIIKTVFPSIPMFSRGGRIVRRYQGGGTTTRAGKPVGTPARRAIAPVRRKPKIKIQPPKSQPGKDVGGKTKIQKLYPDTDPKIVTVKDWMSATDAAGDRPAGTFQQYLESIKDRKDKIPNPFKAITSTAKILKEIPLVGGIMGAAVDIALGQKPDTRVYRSLASGISYLVESIANQRTNESVISLLRDIRGFADGGNIPASRELRNNYSSLNSEDLLSKVLGPTIEQRVNEAIKGIQKELQKKDVKPDGRGPGDRNDAGPDGNMGGGTNIQSIDMAGLTPEDIDALGRMIEAEAGNQSDVGKASVMNVILNRYRLARSGKGYLPRGKTKDTVTIRDLLYAPSQFSPISDGRFNRTSSMAGRRALAQAIAAGGNDPGKLKEILMKKYNLSEQDANYVIVSTAFSNPESRSSRPFNTREVTVGNHTFQESPNARLRVPGERIESNVRISSAQVQALSSGFRTGLKTGPEGRIGAGTGYHIDARFMYDLPLKDKIAMLDSMAAAHAQEGFVMEFSGRGVAGARWNPNASPKEKEDLAKRILVSHHSNRHPWQAFDYFAVKQSARNRSDVSAEGANIMAPRISGGTYEYQVGGGYGRHLIIRDKNGREIFQVGHGDQGLPSPKEIGKIFKMDELSEIEPSTPQSKPGQPQRPTPTPPSLANVQRRIGSMPSREGEVLRIPGIGEIRIEKNQYGTLIKRYYLTGQRTPVEQNKFFDRVRSQTSSSSPQPSRPTAQPQRSQGQVRNLFVPPRPGKRLGEKVVYNGVTWTWSQDPFDPKKGTWKFQGGGLISPSKSNRPIPNSFASYESPGNGMMLAIQPIIIERPVPVGRSRGSIIDFIPTSVNNTNTTPLSIG